jgi:anti-anti-sigma factor
MFQPPPFRVDTQHEGDGRCVLTLVGELDMAAAPRFRAALDATCKDGAESVIVDLSRLSFIDSTGLRAILVGRQLCATHLVEYRFARDLPPPVKRLLEIAGVIDRLPFADEPVEHQQQR